MNLVIIGGVSVDPVKNVLEQNIDNIEIQVYPTPKAFLQHSTQRRLFVDRLILMQDALKGEDAVISEELLTFGDYLIKNFPSTRFISVAKDKHIAGLVKNNIRVAYIVNIVLMQRPTAKFFVSLVKEDVDKLIKEYNYKFEEDSNVAMVEYLNFEEEKEENVDVEQDVQVDGKKKKGLFGGIFGGGKTTKPPVAKKKKEKVVLPKKAIGQGVNTEGITTGVTEAEVLANVTEDSKPLQEDIYTGFETTPSNLDADFTDESSDFTVDENVDSTDFEDDDFKDIEDDTFEDLNEEDLDEEDFDNEDFDDFSEEELDAPDFDDTSLEDDDFEDFEEDSNSDIDLNDDDLDFGEDEVIEEEIEDVYKDKENISDDFDESDFDDFEKDLDAVGNYDFSDAVDEVEGENNSTLEEVNFETKESLGDFDEIDDFDDFEEDDVSSSDNVEESRPTGGLEEVEENITVELFDGDVGLGSARWGSFDEETADLEDFKEVDDTAVQLILDKPGVYLDTNGIKEGAVEELVIQTGLSIEEAKERLDVLSRRSLDLKLLQLDIQKPKKIDTQKGLDSLETAEDTGFIMDNLGELEKKYTEKQNPVKEKIVERVVEKVVHVQSVERAYKNGVRSIIVTGDRRSKVTKTALNLAGLYAGKQKVLYVDFDVKRKGSLVYLPLSDIIEEPEHIQNGIGHLHNTKVLNNLVYNYALGGYDCLLTTYPYDINAEIVTRAQGILAVQKDYKTIIVDCPLENLYMLEDMVLYSEVIFCIEANASSVVNTLILLDEYKNNPKFITPLFNHSNFLVTKDQKGELFGNILQEYVSIFGLDDETINWGNVPVLGKISDLKEIAEVL